VEQPAAIDYSYWYFTNQPPSGLFTNTHINTAINS